MQQKVIRIGNSLGVIIPKKLLDSLEWRVGTKVNVVYNYEENCIYIVRKKQSK